VAGQAPHLEGEHDADGAKDSFSIAVDDDLLAAALAAVEARTTAPKEHPPIPLADPSPGEMAAFEEDLEVEAGSGDGTGGAETEEDWVVAESDDEETDRELPPSAGDSSLDFGLLAAEWTLLQDEIAQARARSALLEERLQAEIQERRRLAGTVRRLTGQLERAEASLNAALEARAATDEQVLRLREAVERGRDDLAHSQRRRRTEREEDARYGHQGALEEMLPVLDHMELAASHAGTDPERLTQGIEMIIGQFRAVLARLGVQRIPAEPGTPFQPEIHEAMMQLPAEGVSEGSIARELNAGYLLHDRLLRPARVAVATAPTPSEADDPTVETAPAPAADPPEEASPAPPTDD